MTVPAGNILGVADSFFVPLGEGRWLATVHTTGPWDERAQHGGPPSALLGRAMQRCEPRDDMVVARFTTEILSSIPVGEVVVRARLARPGRSVQLAEAVLTAAGRDVAWARAWRVLRTDCPDTGPRLTAPPPLPASGAPLAPGGWVDGYLSAIEWRAVRSASAARPRYGPGCAIPWCRARSRPRWSGCWPWPTVATASPGNSTCAAGCSSTQNSPCTCSGSRPGSGSAWTRRATSRRAGPGWRPRSCPTPGARWAWARRRC